MINSRFDVKGKLGEGRSTVYECMDSRTGELYALKVILPSIPVDEKKKFADEFYLLKKLNHPGIIKAYDTGTVFETACAGISEGSRYMLLELFEGKELSESGEIKDEDLRDIIIQIVSALKYLHLSNLVYYDLKPENILLKYIDGRPQIKIIDFAFAKSLEQGKDKNTRGTAEYIAPELLKKEPFDHKVDYYSLGMLLYRIIYGRFPFDNSSEIKIFRAQLEENFLFPENSYSEHINRVMKKLLQKDPAERYQNAVQIFSDLGYTPSQEIISAWVPARRFSGRRDILNILNNYANSYSDGEVFVIRGSEDSGKSAVLKQFAEHRKGTVLIEGGSVSGLEFINELLEKVLYNEEVYPLISEELRSRIKGVLKNPAGNFSDELKGIFSQIIRSCRFILLIDEFNSLDELSIEVLSGIIPLLQVQNIRIVITEDSEKLSRTEFIHNQHQINISPFTEQQVQDLMDKSFYNYYPKEELKRLILSHADLLPGSIYAFIKDLIVFGIIEFTYDGIKINIDPSAIEVLKHSQDYFYRLRVSGLSSEEKVTAEVLSSFNSLPSRGMLVRLLNCTAGELNLMLKNLSNKNILHISGNLESISFTSAGMKNYLYNGITDKKVFHLLNAELLEKYSEGSSQEIAQQYEAAEEYQKSMKYYLKLFRESAKTDAYSSQKKILEHIISLPVPEKEKYTYKTELCRILQKSGDNSAALEVCAELLLYTTDPETLNELLLLKGIALIRCGKLEEGIKEIEPLVEILEDNERKQNLQIEIASAYLDLNNFTKAERICRGIINSGPSEELKGKCFNLFGLISIHRDNDFDIAFRYFQSAEEIYSRSGLKFRTAQMQLNLGNIKNIKGEYQQAEELWKKSFELNSSMGNLQHEATLLLNLGVLYFEKLDYPKSLENYKRALSIFSNTGDQKGEGLINYNLGEIYYLSCDYRNALRYLLEARSVFGQLQDTNEELETLFMLGNLYYALGSDSEVKKIVADMERLGNRQTGEKHNYNSRLLKLLAGKENLNFFHEIKDIIHYYAKQGDKNNFCRASFTAIKFLYEHNLFKEALEEISRDDLKAVVKENDYHNAEWNLYFGLIIADNKGSEVHQSEYYLKAYSLIEHLSISELTWRVLSVLAEFYSGRGNFLRGEEYAYYAKALIEHISDNIDDEKLKKDYLNKKEIKTTLNICRKILSGNG
jgi:serine/threonine protein kinase/tetratricopeptide (TPR) repeat protein